MAKEATAELPEKAKEKIENEREKIFNECWKNVKNILRQKKKSFIIAGWNTFDKKFFTKRRYRIYFHQPNFSLYSTTKLNKEKWWTKTKEKN